MADPNWFYSTLAQSTAALVGLAGGLLVTRVLALRNELASARLDIKGEFDNLVALIAEERRGADLVLTSARRLVTLSESAGDMRDFSVSAGTVLVLFAPTPGTPPAQWQGYSGKFPCAKMVEVRALVKDAAEYLHELPATDRAVLDRIEGPETLQPEQSAWLAQPANAVSTIVPFDYLSLLAHRRDAIRARWGDLVVQLGALGKQHAVFCSRLIPRRFYVLIALLALLLAGGLITPLFYLSYGSTTVRTILLAVFTPLSVMLVGYFAVEVRRLRAAADLTRDTLP
jgi:hypothetical protein